MRSRLATAVAVSAAALALAACGGDDEETTGAESDALSKEAYIQQANEICARVNTELAEVQDFQAEGVPAIEQGIADLSELPAPEGDEEQVEAIISAGQQGAEEIQSDQASQDAFDEFTRLAQEYGIEGGCTGAGGGPGG